MDSGNTSGSIQSSSGDDQEYDSRAETSISAFLINSTSNNPSSSSLSHVGPLPNPPPPPQPPPSQQHHSSSSMFDPLSNYFDNPLSRPPQLTNPNSILNLDLVWSKSLRSEPNCTDLGGFMTTSSPTQQFLTNQGQSSRPTTFGSIQFPQGPENNAAKGLGSVSGTSDQTNTNNNNNMGVRNPKKRSRASRRAPTTVLTTDTTNFRAMVQEFTGIPAPPFTSSPFPRSRLDLFGTTSTLRSAAAHLDPSPPPYLLRPFAQKIHPPTPTPFVSSSSSFPSSSFVDAIASSTTTNITSGTNSNIISTSSNSTPINYQLPQNLLNINMQNPVFNLHSILQAPPNKYPNLGTKPQGSLDISSNDSHLKVGVLEEFGLSHGQVSTNLGGLQNIVASPGTTLPRSDSNPANWAGGGLGSNEGDHQGLLRSINGSYNNSQRVTNGKVNNFSASSSDFHGDKGPENVAARGEGMVESWICSSD